jgi:hypothetical protein
MRRDVRLGAENHIATRGTLIVMIARDLLSSGSGSDAGLIALLAYRRPSGGDP